MKRSEELYDRIGQINEKYVEEAFFGDDAAGQRRGGAVRKGIIAAIVAAAMALSVVGGIAFHEKNVKDAGGNAGEKTPAAQAADDRERFNPFVVSAEYPVYETDEENRAAAESRAGEVSDVTRDALVTLTKALLTNKEGDSAVVAPTSIYTSLSILSDVFAGETRDQLTALLGTDDAEEIHRQASALWDAFYLDCEDSKSLAAASLWLNNDEEYDMDLVNTLSEIYHASVFSDRFGGEECGGQLRNWLNEQTRGLLEDQLDDVMLDAMSSLGVVTTVYRKANWFMQFNETDNTSRTFHGLSREDECTFMNGLIHVCTVEGDGFTAVGLPLKDCSCMWFVLPDEGMTTDDAIGSDELWEGLDEWGKGDHSDINKLLYSCEAAQISIPRFDVSAECDITDDLVDLGVTDMFAGANMTPLLGEGTEGNHYVDGIQTGARVIVNESGVEAAGFTGVYFDSGPTFNFILDRPFVFIMTNTTGLPLFAGVVNQLG